MCGRPRQLGYDLNSGLCEGTHYEHLRRLSEAGSPSFSPFREVWRNLIPAYSATCRPITIRATRSPRSEAARAGATRSPPRSMSICRAASKVLDVCSGTHDIPLRLLALDPTLDVHTVDGSPHMTAEGQRRARGAKPDHQRAGLRCARTAVPGQFVRRGDAAICLASSRDHQDVQGNPPGAQAGRHLLP